MLRPTTSGEIDWPGFWSDLLQGVGAGLLHHDGSPIAQAALAGLEVFDTARERRDRRKSQSPRLGASEHVQAAWTVPWPDMSSAELAAYQQLSPEDQAAFRAELAELLKRDDRRSESSRPYGGPTPASPNPFEGWPLESLLPFGKDRR